METTEKNMEHGEHFNESIVNEVILEDMKKNRIDHMKYLPGMEVLEESDVMDQVISAMNAYDYDKYTEADVRRALAHDNRTPEDFQALLSPAALPLLEEIAQAAQKETRKHFGNSVYMFTPIYIANYCENYCIYCGFNCHNKIRRAKLNAEEIDKEMAAIAKTGICHGFAAIDPAIFGNADDIRAHFSEYLETLRQSPKAEGAEQIYTHGEKEVFAEKERRENGIPVNDNTMVELANLCNYLKVDFGSYFKGYELPKDSKFFSGNY